MLTPLLRQNTLYVALPNTQPPDLKAAILEYRQGELELFRQSHVLVLACRPHLARPDDMQRKESSTALASRLATRQTATMPLWY
ncbi:hypothetical protein NQZ79_g8404 [Umbelopsis isabellina]|nr:hypothetical protein NQZ79_g8404 [Umbelopsis isabellina]